MKEEFQAAATRWRNESICRRLDTHTPDGKRREGLLGISCSIEVSVSCRDLPWLFYVQESTGESARLKGQL